MKIYAQKHRIRETESIGLKDIPLAFLDTEDNEYDVSVQLNPAFACETSERVWPYDVFLDDNPYFFTKDGKILKSIQLKRRNGRFIYEPHSMHEYALNEANSTFGCTVLIKRTMKYNNRTPYNLRIGVAEEDDDLAFSNKLISIFGDANKRGKCPANITVNNGNLLPQSLIANSMKDNDFFIAHSTDGIHIVKDGSQADLQIDTLLDQHINIWLSVDSFGELLKSEPFESGVNTYVHELMDPQLYTKKAYELDGKTYYSFDTTKEHPSFPKSKYRYSQLHASILLLEKPNAGYIIVTPSAFFNSFDNIRNNASLIYEVLMKVYLQSYYESPEVTSWITDEPVDYIAGQQSKARIRHKRINLHAMLAGSNSGMDYTIAAVNTTNPYVMFGGLTETRDMLFYKIANHTDIPKEENEIAYLTTSMTVVNYVEEDVWTGTSKVKIDTAVLNNQIHITLHPFHSSDYKIHIASDWNFRLPDNTKNYCLCTKESSPDIQNVISLIALEKYEIDPSQYGIRIATIQPTVKPAVKTYDIRVGGGGLPTNQPDNYDMVDIGHIDGRPYRVGGSMVVRLPKALKPHEDKIMFALKQHVAAGTYPVLLFK